VLIAALLAGGCGRCGKKEQPGGGADTSSGLPAPVAGDFTMLLVPDPQYYAQSRPDLYRAQMRWIADSAKRLDLVFAIFVGDLTNDNSDKQWKIAGDALQILDDADVPYNPMPGNHDGIKGGIIASERYNRTFPVSRYASRPWYGGHYGDTNDSTYWLFSAGGMDFMLVSLAFGTPQEQLDWANQVIEQHPDRRVIVATHAYLDHDGTWLERGEEFAVEDKPHRWNDGREIWEKVVRRHPNIFLAVCGHVPDQALAIVPTESGNRVINILANYQGYPNAGDGWLRILRFSPARDQIYVEAYSPTLDRWDRRPAHTFTLDYEMPDPPASR